MSIFKTDSFMLSFFFVSIVFVLRFLYFLYFYLTLVRLKLESLSLNLKNTKFKTCKYKFPIEPLFYCKLTVTLIDFYYKIFLKYYGMQRLFLK